MPTNDYQLHQDLIHDLISQIDDLEKDNAALTNQLKAADTEIANLRHKILFLEGGQLEFFEQHLTAKEVKRLDWQFHHQADNRKNGRRHPKYH